MVTLRRQLIEEPGTDTYITGLPGVGKSALVAELAYQLVQEATRQKRFPDGIFYFSGEGLHGEAGLHLLLNTLLACFVHKDPSNTSLPESRFEVVRTLAGKRLLLIFDAIQADFPLDSLLETVLVHSQEHGANVDTLKYCTVLITSRTVPRLAPLAHHLTLEPLEPDSALELFWKCVGNSKVSREAAEHLCQVVGNLPLAIELAAHVVQLDSELVQGLFEQPLRIDVSGELFSRLSQLMATLPPDTQQRFVRLAPLAAAPFSLAQAAALMQLPDLIETEVGLQAASNIRRVVSGDGAAVVEVPAQALMATSLDLVRLRQSSLLEVTPSAEGFKQYHIAPLPQAVNAEILRRTYAETVSFARQYRGEPPKLLHHKNRLLQAVTHAWVSGLNSQVVDLVECMFDLFGRLPYSLSEEILRWGIEASQALNDRYYWVRFITKIGKLKFYQGQYREAQQAYQEGLEIGRPLLDQPVHRQRSQLWVQWANLYHIASMSGDQEAAERFLQPYLYWSMESGNPYYVASAYIKKAYLAWIDGDEDKAAGDMHKSASLLPLHTTPQMPAIALELDLFVARLQQDYEQAVKIAKVVEARMQAELLDRYWLADQKDDETYFARQQHRFEDARKTGLVGLRMAIEVGAPMLIARFQEHLARIPA